MRVRFFGWPPDSFFLIVGTRRKREWVETSRFVVARIVPDPKASSSGKGPRYVDAAGKDTQKATVVEGNVNQHVVGQDFCIQKANERSLEVSVVEMYRGRPLKRWPKVLSRFSKNPPLVPICCSVVLISLGFDAIQDPLQNFGETTFHLIDRKTE